jgi:RNA ligase
MLDILRQYEIEGLVYLKKHPQFDLYISKYTPKTQYECLWDEVTMAARGIIIDSAGKVVARPFTKFFNLEEIDSSEIEKRENMDYEIYEKMDGSLGILYFHDDIPYIATPFGFSSEMAVHATAILNERYSHIIPLLNRECTYLFEIIYPENQIVVNYGQMNDIVLLAVIQTQTGEEISMQSEYDRGLTFNYLKPLNELKNLSLTELKNLNIKNREGFIIRYADGYRVKVKFEDYFRIHKIVTNMSDKNIFDIFVSGNKDEFYDLIGKIPDEFHNEFKGKYEAIENAYAEIEQKCLSICLTFKQNNPNFVRKDAALYFREYGHLSPVLFLMIDERDYRESILNILKKQLL